VAEQDLLSELLRPIRLTGVFRSWWYARAPWSIEGDSEQECAVLHYVVEGECWVGVDDGPTTRLGAGDLAIFPTGEAHRVSDRPDRRGVPLKTLLTGRTAGSAQRIELGGDGPLTRVLCAGLHYDESAASSLYRALPWVMVLDREQVESEPMLRDVLDRLATEEDRAGPGTALVTLRAFEMAMVLTLRPLLGGMVGRPEIVSALRHPELSRALFLMYTRFAEPWTIESLAREVTMSRSAFTARFRAVVGEGPASHLAACRMREAARLLAETDVPQSALPAKVGYGSAVGFHLAFRRHFDMTPGEYRQRFAARSGPGMDDR
jgi:AraC-like DNA-binding protein